LDLISRGLQVTVWSTENTFMPLDMMVLFFDVFIKSELLTEFFSGSVVIVLSHLITLFDFVDEFEVILSKGVDDVGEFVVRLGGRGSICRKHFIQASLHLPSHQAIEFKLTNLILFENRFNLY